MTNPITRQWGQLALLAAVSSIVAVLIIQASAIALWPTIALFPPLDSYVRSAIFTLVPALGATIVFAWLSKRTANPTQAFLRIAVVVLALSIIPDYALPVPNKTILASTVTAFLHVVAAIFTTGSLVYGYQRIR